MYEDKLAHVSVAHEVPKCLPPKPCKCTLAHKTRHVVYERCKEASSSQIQPKCAHHKSMDRTYRIILKFASTADLTSLQCPSADMRPSRRSIGILRTCKESPMRLAAAGGTMKRKAGSTAYLVSSPCVHNCAVDAKKHCELASSVHAS